VLPFDRLRIYPVVLMGDLNVNARGPNGEPSEEYKQAYKLLLGSNGLQTDSTTGSPQTTPIEIDVDAALTGDKTPTTKLPLIDLIQRQYKQHLPTYGINNQEIVLTNRSSASVSHALDYIFYLAPDVDSAHGYEISSTVIEPCFLAKECQTYFDPVVKRGLTQLSDHYGVSAELNVTVVGPADPDAAPVKMMPHTDIQTALTGWLSAFVDKIYDWYFNWQHARLKRAKHRRQSAKKRIVEVESSPRQTTI
jgi:hypothetical protein